jgi:superfamily II DNA or RNA helicase
MKNVYLIAGHPTWMTIEGAPSACLSITCSAFDPVAVHTQAYKEGRWDGRRQLFNGNEFPKGLQGVVTEWLESEGYNVVVKGPKPPVLDLSRLTEQYLPGITLRPHQMALLHALLSTTNGVAQSGTGSGKTECVVAAARYLWEEEGLRSLVIVPKTGLAYQTRERFLKYYGSDLEVGLLADSKRIDGQVVIATAATLAGAFSREVKRQRGKRKVTVTVPPDPFTREILRNAGALFLDECLDPSTKILTPSGEVLLGSLCVGDVVTTPTGGTATIKNVWRTKKDAVRYTFSGGCELTASPDHLVHLGGRKTLKIGAVKDAKFMSQYCAPIYDTLEVDHDDYLYGWFLGDGCCCTGESQRTPTIKFSFRKDVEQIAKLFEQLAPGGFRNFKNTRGDTVFVMCAPLAVRFMKKYHITPGPKSNTCVMAEGHVNMSVVKGLFDTESSRTNGRITIDMTSEVCMRQIFAVLSQHKYSPKFYSLPVPKNHKHAQKFRIALYGDDINRYNTQVGFGITRKQKSCLRESWAKKQVIVDYLRHEAVGKRELIDIELDNEDRLFIANGLIVHNCHHGGSADGWYNLTLASKAVRKYGVSGTPNKGEELADLRLMAATGPVVYKLESKVLVDQGLLAKPKIVMVSAPDAFGPMLPQEIRYRKVGGVNQEYTVSLPYAEAYELGIVKNEAFNNAVVRATKWMVDRGRRTLVITRRKSHWITLSKMLKDANCEHLAIWGASDKYTRDQAKRSLNSGDVLCVLSSTIMDEGEDIPGVDALILAEGVKVCTNSLQRIGRGMRPKAGENEVWVVDFAPVIHPTLYEHAIKRCDAYESNSYLVQVLDTWPSMEDIGDENLLLPFGRAI